MDSKRKLTVKDGKPKVTVNKQLETKKTKDSDKNANSAIAESRKTIKTAPTKVAGVSKSSKPPPVSSRPESVGSDILPGNELGSTPEICDSSDIPTEPMIKSTSCSTSSKSTAVQPAKPSCVRPYPTVASLRKNDPKAVKIDQKLSELAEKTLQKATASKGLLSRRQIPPVLPQTKRSVQPMDHRSTRPAPHAKEPLASTSALPARPPTRRVVKQPLLPSSPPATAVRTASNVSTSPAKRSTANGSTSGLGKKKDVGAGSTKNIPLTGEPSTPRKGDDTFTSKVFHKKQSKSPETEPVKSCKLCGIKPDSRTSEENGSLITKDSDLELEQAQNRISELELQVKSLEDQLSTITEEDENVKDESDDLQENLERALTRISLLEQEKENLVQEMQAQRETFHREMDSTVQDCALAVKSVDGFWIESKKECEELKKKNYELQMKLEVLLAPRPISSSSAQSVPQTPTDCTGETLRDFTNTVNESSVQVSTRIPVDSAAEHVDATSAQSENRPNPPEQFIEKVLVMRSVEVDKENRSEQRDRDNSASKKITGTIKENQKLAMLRKASGGSIRNGLLAWCQSCVNGYPHVNVTNFSTSFADGLALCALIHSLSPTLIDMCELSPSTPLKNYETAVAAASLMGVEVELDVKAIVYSENPPWETILSYIIEIYNVHTTAE